jgi:hypothetical protein
MSTFMCSHALTLTASTPRSSVRPSDRPCISIAATQSRQHVLCFRIYLADYSSTQAKENLGIVAGTELPRRGRCTHYGKSYRWFRYVASSRTRRYCVTGHNPVLHQVGSDNADAHSLCYSFSCCSKVFACDK